MKITTIVLFIMTAVFSVHAAERHSPKLDPVYVEQVKNQLSVVAFANLLYGYLPSQPQITGAVYKKDKPVQRHTLNLEANQYHIITAVCDSDCTDINLKAYKRGELVSFDISSDDIPVIQVKPDSSGKTTSKVTLEVTIPSCQKQRCTYGIGVYQQVSQ